MTPENVALGSSLGGAHSPDISVVGDDMLKLAKLVRKNSSILSDGRLTTKLIDLISLLVDRALRRSIPVEHAFIVGSICIMEVSVYFST